MSMWTSVRNAVAGVAATYVQGVAAAYGVPPSITGAVTGSLVPKGSFNSTYQASSSTPMVSSSFGGGFTPVGYSIGSPAAPGRGMQQTAGTLPRMMGQMIPMLPAGAIIGARNIVRSAAGRILGWFSGTDFIRLPKIMAMIRFMGITAASAAMGLAVSDLAEIWFAHHNKRGRRGGGITASQLRVTRRTVGKINTMHRHLRELCGTSVGVRHHRRPSAKRC